MKNNYILFLIATSLNSIIQSSANTQNIQDNSRKRTRIVRFIDEMSSSDTTIGLPSNNRNTITVQELLKKNKKERSLRNLHIHVIPKIDSYILSKAEQDALDQFEKLKQGTINSNSIQHNFTQTVKLSHILHQYSYKNYENFTLKTIEEKFENFEATEEFDLTEHQDFIGNYLENSFTIYNNKFWATIHQLQKEVPIA